MQCTWAVLPRPRGAAAVLFDRGAWGRFWEAPPTEERTLQATGRRDKPVGPTGPQFHRAPSKHTQLLRWPSACRAQVSFAKQKTSVNSAPSSEGLQSTP